MKFKVLVIIAILLVLAGLLLAARRLKVEKIVCRSQFGPCSETLLQSLAKFRGVPAFEVIGSAKKTLSLDRKVSKFRVRYLFPETLAIDVVERKAEVALGKQGFDGYVLVDKDGYVLAVEKNTSLPIINVMDNQNINFLPGTKISDNLFFAEKLMKYIFTLYSVKLAVYYGDRVEAKLNSGQKVIFPISGDVEVLIGSLNLILSRGEIRMGEIDLRYKNPVIR